MIATAHLLVFAAVAAAGSGGRCPGATATVGSHIPGGGYKAPSDKNVVLSIANVYAGAAPIGYLYHTSGGRDVFASRIIKAGSGPTFERAVKLYTSEGFPNDDAESLVDAGPPIMMWLPNGATFMTQNHLTHAKCV